MTASTQSFFFFPISPFPSPNYLTLAHLVRTPFLFLSLLLFGCCFCPFPQQFFPYSLLVFPSSSVVRILILPLIFLPLFPPAALGVFSQVSPCGLFPFLVLFLFFSLIYSCFPLLFPSPSSFGLIIRHCRPFACSPFTSFGPFSHVCACLKRPVPWTRRFLWMLPLICTSSHDCFSYSSHTP